MNRPLSPLAEAVLRALATRPQRPWLAFEVSRAVVAEPVAASSVLRALVRRGFVTDRSSGWAITEAGLAHVAAARAADAPPALTFASATTALALLGRAAGPAHAAEVDALQALLGGVAGALRAPSDAPLVEALLEALGRRS